MRPRLPCHELVRVSPDALTQVKSTSRSEQVSLSAETEAIVKHLQAIKLTKLWSGHRDRHENFNREKDEKQKKTYFDVSFGRKKCFYDCSGAILPERIRMLSLELQWPCEPMRMGHEGKFSVIFIRQFLRAENFLSTRWNWNLMSWVVVVSLWFSSSLMNLCASLCRHLRIFPLTSRSPPHTTFTLMTVKHFTQ